MKTLKRILALCLMGLLFVSSGVMAEDASDAPETVLTDSKYLPILSRLGIITIFEDGSYHLEDAFTRAQFATVVMRMRTNAEVSDSATGQIFPDVPKEFWASDAIEALYRMNLISGYPDGNFYPDDTLTYAQMIKILVNLLGYTNQAETSGGYPGGYLMTAATLGIKTNTDVSCVMTRADALEVIYKTLLARPLVQVSFGDEWKYEKSNQPLLALSHKVQRVAGRIDATQISQMPGFERTISGKIRINGTLYTAPEAFSPYGMLGQYVTGYTMMDADEQKELLLLELDDRYKKVTLYADEILSVSGFGPSASVTTPTIGYTDETDKIYNVTVPLSATVIRNGSFVGYASDVSDIYTGEEEITLIYNLTNQPETVYVKRYEYYAVQQVDKSRERILDRYGKAELNLGKSGCTYSILRDGEVISINDLSKGDMLAVGYNGTSAQTSDWIDIIVLTKKIDAVLEGMSAKNYIIEGNEYRLSGNVIGNTAIQLGDRAVFWFGPYDEIAVIDGEDLNRLQYAYFFATSLKSDVDRSLSFKLLTQKGNVEYVSAAEKMVLNGTITDRTVIHTTLASYEEQIVKVKFDSKYQVREIHTIGSPEGPVEISAAYTGHNIGGYLGVSYLYRNDSYMFTIPSIENPEDKDYIAATFASTAGEQRTLQIFDLTPKMEIGCAVYRPSGAGKVSIAMASRAPAIVESIGQAVDNEGNLVKKVSLRMDNSLSSYLVRDGCTFSKTAGTSTILLEPGDMILYSTNNAGQIDWIELLYDTRAHRNTQFEKWYSSQEGLITSEVNASLFYMAHGKVTDIIDNVMMVSINGNIRPFILDNPAVTLIGTSNGQTSIETGYAGDIVVGDRVFLRTTRNTLANVMIFK